MSEQTSRPPRSKTPALAHAFLALGDDGAPVNGRTLPRVLVALIAASALACATPLAWAVAAASKPSVQPVATLSSKPFGLAPSGDEDGG